MYVKETIATLLTMAVTYGIWRRYFKTDETSQDEKKQENDNSTEHKLEDGDENGKEE